MDYVKNINASNIESNTLDSIIEEKSPSKNYINLVNYNHNQKSYELPPPSKTFQFIEQKKEEYNNMSKVSSFAAN